MTEVPEWLQDTPEETAELRKREWERLRGDYVPLPKKRTRPSDGKPVGSKEFDYDEYLTRQADKKASDPEKFSREKAANRHEREQMGQRWREHHDFENCNAELKAERLDRERRHPGNYRLLDIWSTIVTLEQSEKLDNIHLRQQDRIANARRLRIRGCGRAAKKAGF